MALPPPIRRSLAATKPWRSRVIRRSSIVILFRLPALLGVAFLLVPFTASPGWADPAEEDLTTASAGSAIDWSSSHSSYPGSKAFDNDTGTGNPNRWLASKTEFPNVYITYQFTDGNAYQVTSYSFMSGGYRPGDRNPKSWTLQGSDNNTDWTVLDTESGVSWTTGSDWRTFTVDTLGAHTYYKFVFTEAQTGAQTYLQLSEIELHGTVAPPGELAFAPTAYSETEGDSGTKTATITVTRTGGSSGAVSVQYDTSDGTATTADGDYVTASGTLNWTDGDAADKTFTVTINGDTAAEGNEIVNLTLSSPGGGATLGAATATLTIQNDDATAGGTLSFDPLGYSETEGDSGTKTVTITVTRTGGSTGAVGVQYDTSDGTATTADGDYAGRLKYPELGRR